MLCLDYMYFVCKCLRVIICLCFGQWMELHETISPNCPSWSDAKTNQDMPGHAKTHHSFYGQSPAAGVPGALGAPPRFWRTGSCIQNHSKTTLKPHEISQRSIFGCCWHKTCSFPILRSRLQVLVFTLMDFLEAGDRSTQPLQVNSGITVFRLLAKSANMLMEKGGCTEVVWHPIYIFS